MLSPASAKGTLRYIIYFGVVSLERPTKAWVTPHVATLGILETYRHLANTIPIPASGRRFPCSILSRSLKVKMAFETPLGSVLLRRASPERELAKLKELHGSASMTPFILPASISFLSHVIKLRCVMSSLTLTAVSKMYEGTPIAMAAFATPPSLRRRPRYGP